MKRIRKRTSISVSLLAMVMVLSIVVLMVTTASALPVPSGTNGTYWLEPRDSSAQYCKNATVDVWINSSMPFFGGTFRIETDPDTCGEFILGPSRHYSGNDRPAFNDNTTVFDFGMAILPDSNKHVLRGRTKTSDYHEVSPGAYHLGNFTMHCNSTTACVTKLIFIPDVPHTYITNKTGDKDTVEDNNATFTCEAVPETFSKELPKGWNLISLPLTNTTNMTVASIMSSVSGSYDALYRYDATTHTFVALSSSDTMEKGVGYFIHMTEAGTWSYNGTAYTNLTAQLEPGLNMVGWVNTSASLPDALSSITGNYWYVARWNAAEQKFEVYVSGAPSEFNDFDTMERGEGYFIAAKTRCTLTYP